MELYITTDLEDWGLGIHFYKNVNIHADYKFAIDLSILFITIQVDFWRVKKYEIVIDENYEGKLTTLDPGILFVKDWAKWNPTIGAAYECWKCHGIKENISVPEADLVNYKMCDCEKA